VLRQSGELNSLTIKVKKNVTAYSFMEGKTLRLKISEVKEMAVKCTPHYIISFCCGNFESSKNCGKNKGKAVSLQAWIGPEGSRKLRLPNYMTTAQDGDKFVSLKHRPPLPP
jgi:hypothetical protein